MAITLTIPIHKENYDTIYTIVQAFPQQIGAMMCIAVLALPHPTPKLPRYLTIPEQYCEEPPCLSIARSKIL